MSVCRFCLCSKPRKDLSELKPADNGCENQSYEDVVMFCLGIQILHDSKVTRKLCVKCYRKILDFHNFKCLALKNDAYLRSVDSQGLINEVFLKDDIKKEEDAEVSDHEYLDVGPVEVTKYEEDPVEVKEECKEEDQSEDEFLSVIKTIKLGHIEETKENAPVKKKRGRQKQVKTKKKEEKPVAKICEECGKEVVNLKQHMLKHTPLEARQRVKCELCNKIFSSKPSQRKHMQRKHLGIKKQCHLCDKSVSNLKSHILTIHNTDALPYQCVPCGRRFISQARLDMHLTIHTKDRPHECDICGNKFRIKVSLLMHKRQVHDKERTHLCQFCPKSFFKKHHLQIHLRSHTKEKPHKCPDCGKYFSSTTVLKNHRLIHSKEKKFKCTLCDMSFASPNLPGPSSNKRNDYCDSWFNTGRSSYLRAHMISHTKEKRYTCQYCGAKFHRSDHRKRHEYTAHLQHDSPK